MQIPVLIPSLLIHCTNGETRVGVEADTLSSAVEALLDSYPLLKTHLYDGKGVRREHVLIFLNEENIDWLDNPDTALKTGDRITILQAVSGG